MQPIIVGPNEGLGFVVREIWVGLAVHDDGDEAVPAVMVEGPVGPMMMPLVAADPKRLETFLRPAAAHLAGAPGGKPIRIVKFTAREDIETLR
jgi:hypothetical protein